MKSILLELKKIEIASCNGEKGAAVAESGASLYVMECSNFYSRCHIELGWCFQTDLR